ncbi:hypothetical protein F7R91_19255 [Streptomyces luteolifulvus]|jgi:hypothetical protein|uniref:Gram-positive cocci surface proteins LPxTG domain-containing protein n=1 Tax=Streptomyces luteolifulvus TaxID=2615112 RepID=A0A6H9UYV9_9ACTN|nr:hypothetical protein [Streptomyces luteolifulvus]KAB1145315.1 hypothetical protein F7R91_19255 [Streptomyces luteolifulvus]
MRSARILFATAAATAALAIAAPGAHAGDDWNKEDSSHSKKWEHDKPHGGMHTGGGALTAVGGDDWTKGEEDPAAEAEKPSKDWGHHKPHGGMHTGGGALAASDDEGTLATPGAAAGGLAVLAAAGAGVYALRRRNAAGRAS